MSAELWKCFEREYGSSFEQTDPYIVMPIWIIEPIRTSTDASS